MREGGKACYYLGERKFQKEEEEHLICLRNKETNGVKAEWEVIES